MLCRSELVRRAERQGASDSQSQRDFGKADDMYLFGLLCAYMVFVPLSTPGSIDLPTLQRLVEVTFRNDFSGLRCASASPSRLMGRYCRTLIANFHLSVYGPIVLAQKLRTTRKHSDGFL